MKRYALGLAGILVIIFALTSISWKPTNHSNAYNPINSQANPDLGYNTYLKDIYETAQLEQHGLSLDVFEKAVTGFFNLKLSGKISADKAILSIADFDQSSKNKRLWIIDLAKRELILNTWVAHGHHSGGDKPTKFSNINNSFQSSMGFYVTGEIYNGQHGRSLRLDGMDEGFNSNARDRAIVVHGASYVSQGTINALGRLGRSQGCPAVPAELSNEVINIIGGKTVLFINVSDVDYNSKYLNQGLAARLASNYYESEKTLDTVSNI
jgi:hypothetical protein